MAEDILKGLDKIRAELEETRIALSAEEAKRAKIRQDYDKAKLEGDKSLQRSLNTDLMRIGKSLKGLSKSNENALEELSNYNSNSLKDLSDKLTLQKESLDFSKASSDLEKQLVVLNKDSNENSLELARLFKDNMEILKDPELSEEQRKLALDQISEIQNLATSEEENREAQRLQKEANSRLLNMASNLESMGDKFDKFSDNFKKGAGLIGALGAIGLMLFSPETLYKIIDSVITFFDDMYKAIQAIIGGDWGAAKDLVMDNLKGIGIAVAGFFAIFGGTIMRGVGSVLRMARTFGQTVGKLGRIFGKIFLPFTVAMGAFAAITGFIEGFKEGGILEGLKQGVISLFDALVAAPLDLLKDGVAWVLGKMGFENAAEALESFSFSDLFTSMIEKLFSTVSSAIDWIGSIFNVDIGGMLTSMLEGLGFAAGFIQDIIFAPIDAAINWVMGMFGFETPEEGFSLKSLIMDQIEKVKDLFTSMLDFIPSFSDIKEGLTSMIPSWMRGFISDDMPEEVDIPEPTRSQPRLAEAREDSDSINSETVLETRETPETVLETRPASERSQRMIRGEEDESVARISESTESTPLAPRIEPTTTPGAVLSSTNNMMDNRAQAAAQTNMTIINASSGGGGSRSGGNVNSATAVTNNISQGFDFGDFVKTDWANTFGR